MDLVVWKFQFIIQRTTVISSTQYMVGPHQQEDSGLFKSVSAVYVLLNNPKI